MTAILQSPNSRLPDMDDGVVIAAEQRRRDRRLRLMPPLVHQAEVNKKIAANYVNWREANIKTGIPPKFKQEALDRMAQRRDENAIEKLFSVK